MKQLTRKTKVTLNTLGISALIVLVALIIVALAGGFTKSYRMYELADDTYGPSQAYQLFDAAGYTGELGLTMIQRDSVGLLISAECDLVKQDNEFAFQTDLSSITPVYGATDTPWGNVTWNTPIPTRVLATAGVLMFCNTPELQQRAISWGLTNRDFQRFDLKS